MSEQTQNNQMLVIALAVVAVLLAAIAGVIIWQQANSLPPVSVSPAGSTPAAPAADAGAGAMGGTTGGAAGGAMGGTTGGATDGAAGGAMGGAMGGGAAAPADPKTSTKVPEGVEPADFVNQYYQACEKDDWAAAYEMLPADKKAGNSPEALKEQVSSYGIESYTVSKAQVEGDKASVNAEQVTGSYGTFVNTWTFEKVDGTWYVTSKAVTGMK